MVDGKENYKFGLGVKGFTNKDTRTEKYQNNKN